MKMTKKLMAMAMCGIMAATSMVGVCAYASDTTVNDNYFITEIGQSDSGIMPYAFESFSLNVSNVPECRQEDTNWCWVACTQYVLRYLGVSKTQSEIYKTAKDTQTVSNNTGTFSEINKAIKAIEGSTFYTGYTATYTNIHNRIIENNIAIIRGYKGGNSVAHDIVCYGYESSTDVAGETDSYVLYVYDPASTNGGYGTLECSKTGTTKYTLKLNGGNKSYSFNAIDYLYGK